MEIESRRKFIKQSALAMAVMAIPVPDLWAAGKLIRPKLSFSTLGCPKWSLAEIVKFAREHDYQGIEIRTILGELDLNKCPDFSAANIQTTKRMIADNGLKITDLGSSATLHETDKAIRAKNMEDAKRFIDLADRLDCPYIRVFPDKLPTDNSRQAILDVMCEGLQQLGTYTKGGKVKVLMESHGDLVKIDEVYYVMKNSEPYGVAMVWDIFNMWSLTKESPLKAYEKLNKYIRHIHVKDGKFVDGKEQYTFLGQGEAPIKEAVQQLYHANFDGYYSFEWEKMWHPELAEPAIAFAQYPVAMRKYFKA